MEHAVKMRGITQRFPLVLANDNVDFDVEKAEIHALVGENGAGKSTLMNILYGLYVPTAGEIEIFGKPVRMNNALDAIKNGIGMVHQHFMLIPRLSVAENVVLGMEPKKGAFFDQTEAVKRVEAVCREFSLTVDPRVKVAEISLGMQQRVEIVKTLYRGADIIILDEPTAVLTPQEIDELGEILQKLKSMGKTVIIITHKLDEVKNFSDRITVLRQGKKVGTVHTADVSPAEITRMMVGKDVALGGNKVENEFDQTVLELKNISCKKGKQDILQDISLILKSGEILGISGIDGSGQTELAEVICGVRDPSSGSVLYRGEDITHATVARRKEQGIAFIPQDRHKDGLILGLSVEDNLLLGRQRRREYKKSGMRFNREAVKANALAQISDFDIRTPTESQAASTLSGGNQQKIVVAREIGGEPQLIVADQPTRGIDVAAIAAIHNTLTDKCNKGCSVVLVSLELDEILLLSDRIAVMNEGRIVGILNPAETTREEIGLMMLGGHKGGQTDADEA